MILRCNHCGKEIPLEAVSEMECCPFCNATGCLTGMFGQSTGKNTGKGDEYEYSEHTPECLLSKE